MELPANNFALPLVLFTGALTISAPAVAQPLGEDGMEIWVDGPAEVQPGTDRDHPDVAVDPEGNAVFVWGTGDIYLRRFDGAGNALEDPVQVNTTTASTQSNPRIAMHDDGSFLVVWQSSEPEPVYNNSGYPWIRTQAFDANAQPVGSEQLMYSTSTGAQNDRHADVAALPGGGYVVVWGQGGGELAVAPDTNAGIVARLISSNGTPNGEAFVVNSTIGVVENDPTVTELDDGGFLVAWDRYPDIFGRRFDSTGEPVTEDYQLSTRAFSRRQSDPDATRGADGRILLVWQGPEGLSGSEIWGRLFTPTLDPLGNDFQINTLTDGTQGHVRASTAGDKGLLVVWESPVGAGDDPDVSIQGRMVTGTGLFGGSQFQINQYTPGGQYDPATGGLGGVVSIVWGSQNNELSGNDDVITARTWTVCGSVSASTDLCDPGVTVPETDVIPMLDGRLIPGEWADAAIWQAENGYLAFKHDNYRLYLLINSLVDNGDDPFSLGGGDQFWLVFDIDGNGSITPGIDRRYRLESGTGNLRYDYFSADGLQFSPLEPDTRSARAEGFGCFFADGSRVVLPESGCNEHRVWELAIDLEEVEMLDKSGRLGYLLASGAPFYSESMPVDLTDFPAYLELTLQGDTRQRWFSSTDPEFEVTQAIQTSRNDVDLVAGKPTAIRAWDNDSGRGVRVLVFGRRNGIELPGSPLNFSDVWMCCSRDRNSNFTERLPDSWTIGGVVDFTLRILGSGSLPTRNLEAQIPFVHTRTPVFWTVPIVNFLDAEVYFPSESAMMTAEVGLPMIAPLEDVEIVRRPMLYVSGGTSSAELKEMLNEYDQATILSWTLGLLLTGTPPFDLPEQITGFSALAHSGLGGSSDRIGKGGRGRVTWVFDDTSDVRLTYAHELNHNVDQASTSTWGLHSRGCGAEGGGPLDPRWPYAERFNIQEEGIYWDGQDFSTVGAWVPDFMSYCRAADSFVPNRWWSPYRWQAWVDNFISGSNAELHHQPATNPLFTPSGTLQALEPGDSFYINARLYAVGGGEFTRVLRQPGIPDMPKVDGDYSIHMLDCDSNSLASTTFTPTFLGDEGEEDPFVSFHVILPAHESACGLELRLGESVLDVRTISANSPTVTLLSPNGDEMLSGDHTVSWNAGDADGGTLEFTLLYSPDGGTLWQPVALGLSTFEFVLDTEQLPGSENAMIRVIASDGANSTHDDSDGAFSVTFKPPNVSILLPVDSGPFNTRKPLDLSGVARGSNGKLLSENSMYWSIGDTVLGVGESISVYLDAGDYTLVLTAADNDGLQAMASIEISMRDLGDNDANLLFFDGFENN